MRKIKAQQEGNEGKQLADLLRYQDDSIVGRVLLKNQGGTVTLFAFDQGEGLSEHTAPFEALVVVIDGDADIEIAGESFKVGPGETITLPANRPHALKAATRFTRAPAAIRAPDRALLPVVAGAPSSPPRVRDIPEAHVGKGG